VYKEYKEHQINTKYTSPGKRREAAIRREEKEKHSQNTETENKDDVHQTAGSTKCVACEVQTCSETQNIFQ
jgi:NAD-dependent SIR2 family protein deacetylase